MRETLSKKETPVIIGVGLIIGILAVALVYFGNPANMGFCIACFLRDTAGALGFHSAAAVQQYIRPEIVGLVLGSCILALATKEFKPRGGSAPVTRFVIGMFVMVGCLMFLGCPFRMILRLAGGDFNAIFGLIGFVAGILAGVFFLKKGLGGIYARGIREGLHTCEREKKVPFTWSQLSVCMKIQLELWKNIGKRFG